MPLPPYINFILYCMVAAVVVCIIWQCVFAPYKKYREEQLLKFNELVSQDLDSVESKSETKRGDIISV